MKVVWLSEEIYIANYRTDGECIYAKFWNNKRDFCAYRADKLINLKRDSQFLSTMLTFVKLSINWEDLSYLIVI